MEERTTANEVIDFFESSFADKQVIPLELEIIWLRKAVSRYSLELDKLIFDSEILSFDKKIDDITMSTLAAFMKEYYQERITDEIKLLRSHIAIPI